MASLRITGSLAIGSPANSTGFFANSNSASLLATIKMNSGTPANAFIGMFGPSFIACSTAVNQFALCGGFGPGYLLTSYNFQVGGTYFISAIWNAGSISKLWVNDFNGTPVTQVTGSSGGWASSAQMLLGQFFNPGNFVGSTGFTDYQIQNIAISGSYLLTNQDVLDYRNAAKTPLQIDASFSWWTLSGTIGQAPTLADAGFQDQNARAVNFSSLLGGSLSNAVYAPTLVYTAPTVITPQVSKSGKWTMFVATDAGSSTPQALTAVANDPTIAVQFGSTGSPQIIQTWGPITSISATIHDNAFASYQNICGPVESVVVQKGGANYSSSPSASATGVGGGTAPTFGTPVVTGGVTSYTVNSDSGGHASPPQVTVNGDGSGGLATATLTSGTVTAINVFWPGTGYTVASAMWTGGSATGHVSNRIKSVPILTHGSQNTGVVPITITDSTGSGAVAVAVMGGVQPSDHVLYGSVPDGWITSMSGIAAGVAITNAAVQNWSGQLEGPIGTVRGFNQPPTGTFGAGFNSLSNQPSFSSNNSVNWRQLSSANGAPLGCTWDMGSNPINAAATAAQPVVIVAASNSTSNGVLTFVADEVAPSTPMSVGAGIPGGPGSVSVTQVSAGTATTGVTSVTLIAGGSGWTDRPRVTLSCTATRTPTAYAKINSAGNIIGLFLLDPGFGVSGAVTVVFTSVDGNGSGATGTATTGPILSGVAWQATLSGVTPATGLTNLDWHVWNTVGGTYPWTLQNVFLFSPEETALWTPALPPRTNPLRLDAGMKTWLVSQHGNGPSVLRFMSELGLGLAPGAIEAEDLVDVNNWQYQLIRDLSGPELALRPTGPRVITVDNIRTWRTDSSQVFPSAWGVTWTSPNVYHNYSQFGNVNSTFTGYGTGADTSGPYVSNLTAAGINQGMLNYNFDAQGSVYVAEFHTTAPHNLKTGQMLNRIGGSGSFQIANDNAGGTATGFGGFSTYFYCVVTGPQTFAALGPQPATYAKFPALPGNVYNVAGSFAITMQFHTGYPQAGQLSVEAAAGLAASLPGCALHLNIPYNGTDLCIASIARRVRDIMPVGSRTLIEQGNELWNLGGQAWGGYNTFTIGQLRGRGFFTSDVAGAIRLAESAAIFRTVYNQADINGHTNRGNEVGTIIGGQFGSQWTVPQITYFNSIVEPLAAACTADYESTNQQDPNFVLGNEANFTAGGLNVLTAFATLASHWPTSNAYLWTHPLSRAACIDWYRYQLKYDQQQHGPSTNGVGGAFDVTNQALAAYTGPSPSPKQIGYEGGVDAMCPIQVQNATDPDGGVLYFNLNGDLSYDPAAADAVYAWCQSQEAGGMALGAQFVLARGTFYVFEVWSSAGWRGQPVGLGDGSVASDGNAYTNKFWMDDQQFHDFGNVTPKLLGYQRWQDGLSQSTVLTGTINLSSTAVTGALSATPGFTGMINLGSVHIVGTMSTDSITQITGTIQLGSSLIVGTLGTGATQFVGTIQLGAAHVSGTIQMASISTGNFVLAEDGTFILEESGNPAFQENGSSALVTFATADPDSARVIII